MSFEIDKPFDVENNLWNRWEFFEGIEQWLSQNFGPYPVAILLDGSWKDLAALDECEHWFNPRSDTQ